MNTESQTDRITQLENRLQAVEKERDRYKAALETLEIGLPEVGASFLREEVRLVARKALQPAQKDAPEKGTK